jgi:hypothetical protein
MRKREARMGNRSARFISTLVASIVAGAPLAAVSQTTPPAPAATIAAADDCLTAPKGETPQGQHWSYHVDRASKKKCWHLRAEGSKAVQTVQNTQADAPAQRVDSPPLSRALQDAHAEFVQQPPVPAANVSAAVPSQASSVTPPPTAPRANVTADGSAQQPTLDTRWPDPANTAAAPQAAPAPDAQPAAAPAPVALAAADAPAGRPTGSLQMLLLVVGGALALAGIIGSVIYRFGGRRLRLQANGPRRVHWDNRDPQDHDHAPWHNAVPATATMRRPLPVDFDLMRRPAAKLSAIAARLDTLQPHDSVATHAAGEIEAFDADASAPQLAAIEAYVDEAGIETTKAEAMHLEPVHADEAATERPADDDTVDIDVITKMLERLAKDGPRLSAPSPEAGLAGFAQTRRGPSAARA